MTDFHELYIRYAGDIYRFSLYLSGNATMAEDITAETFARALTSKKPIVSSTVKSYLLTIARNLYIESYRRRKQQTEISPEYPDTNQNLVNLVSQKSELEELQKYLQTFSEADRSALLLRADGLPYHEIADILSISVVSAKVKVHRLRLKLAEWRMNRENFKPQN